MIKHLYIENFILIDKLALDFEKGFNAFVGETGAGKSILIDAISLLCADRGSSSYISKGKSKAIIEGTFDLSKNKHAIKCLEDSGLDTEGDITFTRELFSTSKSVVRINHRIVSLSLMKNILRDEIDIHGQRDNAYLLDSNEHIHLLDAYLNLHDDYKKVESSYSIYKDLCLQKEKVLQEKYNESDLEYFEYQVKEINDANLKAGEEESLLQKEKEYQTVKNSFSNINEVIEDYNSIEPILYSLNKKMQTIADSELFNRLKESINESYYSLNDSISDLKKYSSSVEYNEEDINTIEERLFLIQKLKHKYDCHSIDELIERKSQLENKLKIAENMSNFIQDADKQIENAYKTFLKQAEILSEKRKKGKEKLDKDVTIHLKDLSLPNAKFYTHIENGTPSKSGIDKVEFLISMNKGEDLKPLAKTASGGELSRLMLGLKVIFTHLQGIQTIIFDEIDTGVSGTVASSIGKKMKTLSKDCQVFTVTHLAPVASYADNFYLVKKNTFKDSTTTTVKKLNKKETIHELALIASGSDSDFSLKAAEELLNRSKL